jgi:hypothetical protein
VSRNVVIAVDATERSLDALALGRLLAGAAAAPPVVVTVFPYDPLADPTGDALTGVREDARGILLDSRRRRGSTSPTLESSPAT